MKRIAFLKKEKVTGGSVVLSWIGRRIQPLQSRCNLGFEYIGIADPSRFSGERIEGNKAMKLVQWILSGINQVPVLPKVYHVLNPPSQVMTYRVAESLCSMILMTDRCCLNADGLECISESSAYGWYSAIKACDANCTAATEQLSGGS